MPKNIKYLENQKKYFESKLDLYGLSFKEQDTYNRVLNRLNKKK